ncbi:MAG: GNAT family N-acetyltransferase [Oligoflexia bacterium]|nr:GNAT family N-acetyltransferase [Oligoflexia bacterium]MBF0365046.1 GNAT family N-acetyltransferase [Oligoflexia bacterium]
MTAVDIEVIRQWRNNPQVLEFMPDRRLVTMEQQKKWYESICNQYNYYYMIHHQQQQIGLAYLKDIDNDFYKGTIGIFMAEERFFVTTFPIRASIALVDYAIAKLNIKKVVAGVLQANKKSKKYCLRLGFYALNRQELSQENEIIEYFEVDSEHVRTCPLLEEMRCHFRLAQSQ